MMLRLASLAITAVAAFYALEGAGVVDKRVYFPTLPRLESSAANPAAWLDAASWGVKWVSCASAKGGLATCAHRLDGTAGSEPSTDVSNLLLKSSAPAADAETAAPAASKFTDRVAAKRKPTA